MDTKQMGQVCPILFQTVTLSCILQELEPEENEEAQTASKYIRLSRCVQHECAWWNPDTKLCAVHQQKGA